MSYSILTPDIVIPKPDQFIERALLFGEPCDYPKLVRLGHNLVYLAQHEPAMHELGVFALNVRNRTDGNLGLAPLVQTGMNNAQRAVTDTSQLLALRLAGQQPLEHYMDVLGDPLMDVVLGLHGVASIRRSEAERVNELVHNAVGEALTLAHGQSLA